MARRPVVRSLVVAGLALALAGAGGAATVTAQAGAAVHKKHPPKHHKKSKTSSEVKKLKSLGSHVAKEKSATFEVVYTTTFGGHTQSITFAQAPPKFLMKTSGGSVVDTGAATLFCASTSECVSAGAANPLGSLQQLFSPTTARTFFQHAAAALGAKEAGYSVSFSSATFAGLSSECASVSGNGVSGKYCVASNGLLAYAGSSAGNITLTSYTTSVPGTAFTPPSGATIITEPTT